MFRLNRRTISYIQDDRKRGEAALKFFFDYSKRNFSNNFKWSFEELIKHFDSKSKSFIEGLGLGIKFTNASDSRIERAMKTVAEKSRGGIPKDFQVFTMSLSQTLQDFDIEAWSEIAAQTAKDVEAVTKTAIGGYSIYKIITIATPFVIWWLTNRKKK